VLGPPGAAQDAALDDNFGVDDGALVHPTVAQGTRSIGAAHRLDGDWVGDECHWDERLYSSE
jgi:hypothetical protein